MAQQINLYNPALRRQRELLTLDNLGLATVVLVAILLAIGGGLRWRAGAVGSEVREIDARIAGETARLAELTARAGAGGAKQDLEALQRQLAERREVLDALRGGAGKADGASGFADYLRGLARQSVNGLWLTGFAVGRGGENMEIRGRMLDAASLPDYIRRLNSEPGFHGRQFLSLNVERGTAAAAAPGATPTAATPGSTPAATAFNSFVLTGVVPAAARDKEPAR